MEEAEGRAGDVPSARRGDGVPGAHLHRGLHQGRAPRQGAAVQERGPLHQVPDMRRAAAPHPALRHLQQQEALQRCWVLLALQADVAAVSAPLFTV